MPYNIGDIGPAGGFIFATPYTVDNPTQYYYEAAKDDGIHATTPFSPSGTGSGCNLAPNQLVQGVSQFPSPLTTMVHGAEFGWYKTGVSTGINIGDGWDNTQQLLTLAYPSNGNPLYYPNLQNEVAAWVATETLQGPGPAGTLGWYLPSLKEAVLMMQNIGPNSTWALNNWNPGFWEVIPGLSTPYALGRYWTSSTMNKDNDDMMGYNVDSNGVHHHHRRCHTYSVRAIRRFTENWEPNPGCMDASAFNYDPSATAACDFQNPSNDCCLYEGCPATTACNYDPAADGCVVGGSLITGDTSCCVFGIPGCVDPTANNFNPNGNADCAGICPIPTVPDLGCCDYCGCTHPLALNYNPNATANCDCTIIGNQLPGWDSCCKYQVIKGCIDSIATNYNPFATVDDGSCVYLQGCQDPTALNYDPLAIADCIDPTTPYPPSPDFSCCMYPNIQGCTDLSAVNYNSLADFDCIGVYQGFPADPLYPHNPPVDHGCCRYRGVGTEFNWRDGSAGMSDQRRLTSLPLQVPGLAGSAAVDIPGITITNWTIDGVPYNFHPQHAIVANHRDALIGWKKFRFKVNAIDVMGNEYTPSDFVDNSAGYTFTIFDKFKNFIGSWKYDTCAHTANYGGNLTPGGRWQDYEYTLNPCVSIPTTEYENDWLQAGFGGYLKPFIILEFKMANDGYPEHLAGQYPLAWYGSIGARSSAPGGFNSNTQTNPGLIYTGNWPPGNPTGYVYDGGSGTREWQGMHNARTASGAYIKLDWAGRTGAFGDINGPNTSTTDVNVVCDNQKGAWANPNSSDCPHTTPNFSFNSYWLGASINNGTDAVSSKHTIRHGSCGMERWQPVPPYHPTIWPSQGPWENDAWHIPLGRRSNEAHSHLHVWYAQFQPTIPQLTWYNTIGDGIQAGCACTLANNNFDPTGPCLVSVNTGVFSKVAAPSSFEITRFDLK